MMCIKDEEKKTTNCVSRKEKQHQHSSPVQCLLGKNKGKKDKDERKTKWE